MDGVSAATRGLSTKCPRSAAPVAATCHGYVVCAVLCALGEGPATHPPQMTKSTSPPGLPRVEFVSWGRRDDRVIGHDGHMPDPDRTPNIRDVARLAGVSHQTVSRALNDSANLRAGTRDRVLSAIEQLGYRPNQAARALSSKRSRLIGVLSTQTGHYGPSKSVQAIEVAARDAGYQLTVSNIAADDSDAIRAGLDALVVQRVEAIVVVAPQVRTVEAIRELSIDVPFVTLEATGLDQVHGLSVDQVGGARLAVRHLVALGHARIAHVSGPLDWVEARARVAGYEAELAASNLQVRPPLEGDWTAEAGFRLGTELLSAAEPPTGGLRRERPARARAAPRCVEARTQRAARPERRGLRRHAGGGALPAPAHHGATGLLRDRTARDGQDRLGS